MRKSLALNLCINVVDTVVFPKKNYERNTYISTCLFIFSYLLGTNSTLKRFINTLKTINNMYNIRLKKLDLFKCAYTMYTLYYNESQ